MKLKLLVFESKAPAWLSSLREEYAAKIKPFLPLEIQSIKSPSAERDNAEIKCRKEGELLLRQLDDRDLLILFEEGGRLPANSEAFAKLLGQNLETGKAHLVFCIGGPYGFSPEVKRRAQAQWSLSPLTFNHWVAQLVALEQIYRGFTILKGIPYHNR